LHPEGPYYVHVKTNPLFSQATCLNPEIILLGSMFKKKLVAAFALNVFLVAIVAGYLINYLVY